MWNWYVTSLAVGSAIVCYDGSPFVPHANILFDIVDKIGFVLHTGFRLHYLQMNSMAAASDPKL